MSGAGSALMGIGSARGEDRAVAAAEMAISSPLLEASIEGAHGVLLSVAGGSDLGLFEINEAAQLVAEAAHPDANIIFGAVIDDALGDEVRVTVIAAGFDGGSPRPARQVTRRVIETPRTNDPIDDVINVTTAPAAPASIRLDQRQPERVGSAVDVDAGEPARRDPAGPRRTIVFEDEADELDVPDFLK
jgi:cell division protein FtsZ